LAQTMDVLVDLEALTDTEIGAVIARSQELLYNRAVERMREATARQKEVQKNNQVLLKSAGVKLRAAKKKERK
jgi:hypothetical protein